MNKGRATNVNFLFMLMWEKGIVPSLEMLQDSLSHQKSWVCMLEFGVNLSESVTIILAIAIVNKITVLS